MADPPDGENGFSVGEEVRQIGLELSQKFVPEPEGETVLKDLLVALQRFRHSVRWKKFWADRYLEDQLGEEIDVSIPDSQESEDTKLRRSDRIRLLLDKTKFHLFDWEDQ